jgi:hypothetical protein
MRSAAVDLGGIVQGYKPQALPMANGEWVTNRERKQLAVDAREQEREQLRLEKRHLRDLRWAVERSSIEASDWADLLALQQAHGKEGPLQLWRELVPYWRACQRCNGGADIPAELFPQTTGLFPRGTNGPAPAVRVKASPGSPRKKRSDAGRAQSSRKRTNATT